MLGKLFEVTCIENKFSCFYEMVYTSRHYERYPYSDSLHCHLVFGGVTNYIFFMTRLGTFLTMSQIKNRHPFVSLSFISRQLVTFVLTLSVLASYASIYLCERSVSESK